MLVAFWRTLLLYLLVIASLRFMGKRQIGELQPSELVTTIMISNIAAIPIENMDTPLVTGLIPIVALACLEVLSSALSLKSRKARGLIVGRPRALIRNGTIDQRQMQKMRWSIDDLMEQLRGNGVFDISEVDFAVVETNGSLSVYQKFASRPASNSGLGISLHGCEGPPAIVINDGEIVPSALQFCNLSERWLLDTLHAQNLTPEKVFLMSCDNSANYKIVKKEGRP